MLNSVLVREKKYSFSASVCPQAHVPVLPWLLLNISWPSCCPVFRPPRFGLIYFDTRVTGNTAAVNQVTTLCQYNPVHVCIQHDPDPGSRHLRLVWTVRCVAARSPSSPITRSIVSNVTEAAGNSPRWRLHIFFSPYHRGITSWECCVTLRSYLGWWRVDTVLQAKEVLSVFIQMK